MAESPSPTDPPRRDPKSRLCVLTFNTYMGCRLDEVARVIREVQPDVAFLQELLVYRYRDWTWHQARSLAAEFDMNVAYQRIVRRKGTDIGVCVLTGGQITEAAPIPGTPKRPTGMSARVSLGGRTVSVAAVHMTSVPRPLVLGYPLIIRTHVRQVTFVMERLEALGGPAIVAGDFNTIPGTPAHRTACRHLNDTARLAGDRTGTRRTLGWPMRIDYIYASAHFRCERYEVLSAEGSDHRPVVATLSWNRTDGPDGPTPQTND